MALSEREELELLELEDKEAGNPQSPPTPGMWDSIKSKVSEAAGSVLKPWEFSDFAKPDFQGPTTALMSTFAAPSGAAKAVAGVAKPVLGAVESFATSPGLQGAARDSGVLTKTMGGIENAGQKLNGFLDFIPKTIADIAKDKGILPKGNQVAEFITGSLSRRGARHLIPGVESVQKVADVAEFGPRVAQKTTEWILDHAPQKLGRFAPILKKASEAGAQSLATTEFILGQKEPEYQKIMKDMRDGE